MWTTEQHSGPSLCTAETLSGLLSCSLRRSTLSQGKKNVLKYLCITYTGTYEGMHRAGGSPAFIWGSRVLAGCFTTKGSACVCVAGAIHFAVCKHRRPTKGCGVAKKPRCPRRMHVVAAHGRHSQFYLCACTGCMALVALLRDAEGLYKST